MSKQRVLLLGATGETGGDILNSLVEDGGFDISLIIRPSSTEKPEAKSLRDRGFPFVISDLTEPVDELAEKLKGFDTVISAIDAGGLMTQLSLIDASGKAGVKRFIPCFFGTICPPGGVMQLRDVKEVILNAILVAKLPYTVVDVGYWYQVSLPRVPSGRLDYAIVLRGASNRFIGDGSAKNILTDKRDVGRLMVKIIKDHRTLNHKVVTVGEVLSQNETWDIVEKVTGEKPEKQVIPESELMKQLDAAKEAASGATGFSPMLAMLSYDYSKYIREDNTPENSKYLGYLDAQELYPDFKPITFEEFLKEVSDGKAAKIYGNGRLEEMFKAMKKESGTDK